MEVRSRQNARSVCIKRRHGAMSAGEVLEKESFVCYVKAVALIGLRGRGRGGKRRRGGRSLVEAALSKIGAGMALLVREVGVALLLCFYSGSVTCVSAVFASRVLSRCRNRTCPLYKKYPECLYADDC